jgi:hypothetical protein
VKTEDLTAMLAANLEPIDPTRTRRRYVVGITTGLLGAFSLVAGVLHLNPALPREATQSAFWVREVFCASLSVLAVLMTGRLARPGSRLGVVPAAIVGVVFTLWILAAAALLSVPPESRLPLLLGSTFAVCPFLIALAAAPLFLAFVWVLKDLAPTRLRWAGAGAGFAAGAMGALTYSLHCPELAAPFIGVWYLLGMLIPTAIGASLGRRLLRW